MHIYEKLDNTCDHNIRSLDLMSPWKSIKLTLMDTYNLREPLTLPREAGVPVPEDLQPLSD